MHKPPPPRKHELRNFGLLLGTFTIVIFGFLWPWVHGFTPPIWPWIIAFILWCLALLSPVYLKPIYDIWMRIGMVLGWINTRVILGIIFFGMVTPMGAVMRIFKHDSMTRKLDGSVQSYRVPSQIKTIERMEKPF